MIQNKTIRRNVHLISRKNISFSHLVHAITDLSPHVKLEPGRALEGEDLVLDAEVILRALLLPVRQTRVPVWIPVELSRVDARNLLPESGLGFSGLRTSWDFDGHKQEEEGQEVGHPLLHWPL